MTQYRKSYLYAASAAIIWSMVPTANKMALRDLDNFQLWLVATMTGLIFLGMLVLCTGKYRLLREFRARDFRHYAVLGLLSPFMLYLAGFKSYTYLPGQIATLMITAWTIILPVLSIPVLKKVPSRREWIGICIAFFGLLAVASNGSLTSFQQINVPGVAVGLIAALSWSLFWLFNTKSRGDPLVALFLCFAFAMPWIWGVTLAFSSVPGPEQLRGVGWAIFGGLAEMGVPYVLWFAAMRLTDSPAKISALALFTPCLSLIFLAQVLGERILDTTLIGLALVLGSNLMLQWEVVRDALRAMLGSRKSMPVSGESSHNRLT